jgi:hypothetical protein
MCLSRVAGAGTEASLVVNQDNLVYYCSAGGLNTQTNQLGDA